MGEEIIKVKGLSFAYGKKKILDNISFAVQKGDFWGIIGANGSGKSTLLKLLVRIILPSAGEIRLWGERQKEFKEWYRMGYLSQKATSFNNNFPATVEEVVGAQLFSQVGLFRTLGRREEEKINKALALVDMKEYKKYLIGNLSGGQQQRIFIARALVAQPEVLLLDEPSAGIDSHADQALGNLLQKLNKELGITILVVSHDLSFVTLYANKIAKIKEKGLTVSSLRKGSEEIGDISI